MDHVITGDGSHTLFSPVFNEHYHSTFGAVTESKHIFIETGLHALPAKPEIVVFEVGFGAGLNALLTCADAIRTCSMVTYYAIELYPIDHKLVEALNYPDFISTEDSRSLFLSLHRSPWNRTVVIRQNFLLHKISDSLITFQPEFTYDVIYFDAFAPEKQPGMWTPEIFSKLYNKLNTGGVLTTYCVKGEVKRMLKKAGFMIEKLPGPPGKREILRGWKK